MSLPRNLWRHVLPWIVSAALLVYVFGYRTDWGRLRESLEQADVPLFLFFATCDRLAFFLCWTLLQGAALRRFVVQVPMMSVVAVRGGSEIFRAVSNPLSDAAFFVGVVRLAGGRIEAVLAAALVPGITHYLVMLVQMTVAWPFLSGGLAGNRDVAVAVVVQWIFVAAVALLVRVSASFGSVRFAWVARIRDWLGRFSLRELQPFFVGFAALAVFDVIIQGLASRTFGVPIGWASLAARLPLVYLSFVIPTLGNFGMREATWSALFSEYGPSDTLIAYAFSVNIVFLILNVLLGVVFFGRALELVAEVRRANREGEPVPQPVFRDPTDG